MIESFESSIESQIPSLSASEGTSLMFKGSFPHDISSISNHPSLSSSLSVISGTPSPSVSNSIEIFNCALADSPAVVFAQILYIVPFIISSGVPQIVPLFSPNSKPFGNSGTISHDSGAEPDVWPAKGCIALPLTSCNEGVGNVRLMPFPVIIIVNVVLTDPPLLLAHTV